MQVWLTGWLHRNMDVRPRKMGCGFEGEEERECWISMAA
jgi:hypothetical protein